MVSTFASAETPPPFETDDGVALHYEVRGDGADTLILPLAWVVGDLSILEEEFRIVTYDPRARGRSPEGPEGSLSMERDLEDLEQLREALGIERASLIGASYYGALVARYAAQHPDRVERLVLLAPMALSAGSFEARSADSVPAEPATTTESNADPEPKDSAESEEPMDPAAQCRANKLKGLKDLYSDPRRFDSADLGVCDLVNEQPAGMARWASQLFASLGSWNFTDELRGLPTPTLIVQGANDQITPPLGGKEWSTTLPNARLLWVEDCGHLPWKEHPDRIRPAVLDFLIGLSRNPT